MWTVFFPQIHSAADFPFMEWILVIARQGLWSEAEIQELNEKQLEITTQYAQTPEDEALDDLEAGEGQQGQGENGTEQGGAGEGENQPAWMSYPIDPDTGYRVNPETGQELDAQTGELIDPDESALGENGPVNENLVNANSGQESEGP